VGVADECLAVVHGASGWYGASGWHGASGW
jgi:hypothetical protein